MTPRLVFGPTRRIAAALLTAACWLTQASGQTTDPQLAAAQQAAAASGRHVVLHFWATWCPPCMRLEREVFHSADVQRQINERYVMVKVDADQNRQLVQQFGIRSFPTDVVLDAQGRVLYQGISPQGPSYLAKLNEVAAMHPIARPSAPQLAQQPQPATPPVPANVRPAAPPHPVAAAPTAPPPMGLDGYCPVTLLDSRAWKAGDKRFGAIHRGRLYLFPGPEQQQRFLANPDRYGPVASGIDTVVAAETGQQVPGVRAHGVIYGDRVYLFANEDSLKRFMQQPARFAQTMAPVRR